MAVTPPTVRPSCLGGRNTADRVVLSSAPAAVRPPVSRRRWRLGGILALSLLALFIGLLAVSAWAAPSAPSHASQQPPPSIAVPTLPTCSFSGQVGCTTPTTTPTDAPATTSTTTPTTTTPTTTEPCTGEDCIPQPTTPPSDTDQQAPGADGNDGGAECGITDVGACFTEAINSTFRGVVDAALSPILELIGHTALSTPTIGDLPGIGDLWNNNFELVVAAYGLLVLIGGIVVMSHESVQTRYSIKEIGPRIPLAFIASTLSLFFADKLIRLANALTMGILGNGVGAPSLGTTFKDAMLGISSGGLFIILVALALVVVGLGLLIVYVFRVFITLILVISAPLFLMFHATPQTDPLACWWWKAMSATLAIQVAQALVLLTGVRTFLSGGVNLFGSTLSALGMLIGAIALFFILFKIPFWLLHAVKVGSGRSFLGGLARAYVAAKTFGMVASKTGAFRTAGTAKSRTGGHGHGGGSGGGSGSADPPWPVQASVTPTPQMVNQRLQVAYDAERARTARRSRLPSQAPRFLQPQPQKTTHDPALTPATLGPTAPEFSSAPTPATPTPRQEPRPGSTPSFRTAGAPRRRGDTPPPARPIRVASVPPQLRFQPAAPPTPQRSTPARPASVPAAPAFRQAPPEPRIGDAYRRTASVPPPMFRAPNPAPRGDST